MRGQEYIKYCSVEYCLVSMVLSGTYYHPENVLNDKNLICAYDNIIAKVSMKNKHSLISTFSRVCQILDFFCWASTIRDLMLGFFLGRTLLIL